MAVLGKRKAPEANSTISRDEDAEAIFRRHFEAQFAPLDEPSDKKKTQQDSDSEDLSADDDDDDDDDDDVRNDDQDEGGGESEWGGLSDEEDDSADKDDDDDEPVVEVVDHSSSQTSKPISMSKRDLRAFMSSRPPDQTSIKPTAQKDPDPSSSSAAAATLPEDAPSLLAQDLELRRLLSESHLLTAPSISSSSDAPKPFMSGRIRHRATDLRVQSLGASSAVLKQESMPMKIRKGMVAASTAREAKRRKEARENGIILERPNAAAAGAKKKRVRSRDPVIDQPGMGRFKGAELRLDDRAVQSIENSRDAFGRRSGGAGGRGGRGGKRR